MTAGEPWRRLERFYRPLIGDRADQLALLKNRTGVKVARAIPARSDQDRLLRLARRLELTFDPARRPIPTQPIYDDAVLIDAALAGPLAADDDFEQGRFYLQAAPSYLAIRHLPLEQADYILDLCASPGGKTIHAYDRLGRTRPVLANEYSSARRARLVSVLRTYRCHALPILGLDAGTVCRYVTNTIPLVILDAPCSGEAHLIRNRKRLAEWRPRQSKALAVRQRAMAAGALHAIRPGGLLLYATCAFSPYENELMIHHLLAKFGSAVEPAPWPKNAFDALSPISPDHLGPVDHVEDTAIDPRIVRCAWRFWPAAFSEPFFAILLRKLTATEPKRPPKPVPITYPLHKRNEPAQRIRIGAKQREFRVPANWPPLPELPYLRLG